MDNSTGIQVLITSKNCAEYLNSCLSSIEVALNGYKWMLIFCDDAGTDNTEEIINNFKLVTSADLVLYQKFSEASSTIGEAKNRTCLLSLNYKNDYPVLCFMDADDEMGPERISGLLPHVSQSQPIVYGDYKLKVFSDGIWRVVNQTDKQFGEGFTGTVTTSIRSTHLNFGHWATLILSDLIPQNGIFFREDIENYDDFLTWWDLKYSQNVNIVPVSGFITHYYKVNRPNSCGECHRPNEEEIIKKLYDLKSAIHPVPET